MKIIFLLILFTITISIIQFFAKITNALTSVDSNQFMKSQYDESIEKLNSYNIRNNYDSMETILDSEKQRKKDEEEKLASMKNDYQKFQNNKDKISYSYFDAQKFIEDYPDSPNISEIQNYVDQFEVQIFDSEESIHYTNGYLGKSNGIYFYDIYIFSDVTMGNMTIKSGAPYPFDMYIGELYELSGRFKIKNLEFDGIFVFESEYFKAGIGSKIIYKK